MSTETAVEMTHEGEDNNNGGEEFGETNGEMKQVSHLVPEHVRDAAKTNSEYGELSEKVRVLYETIAFGEEIGERSQIERELRSVREKKDQKRAEKRELQTEIQNLEQREARLEDSLTNLSSKEDKFEGAIEMLEEQLYSGGRVDPDHGGVRKAAGLAKCTPQHIIERLKKRNPGIPDHAYEQALYSNKSWDGCTEDQARSE